MNSPTPIISFLLDKIAESMAKQASRGRFAGRAATRAARAARRQAKIQAKKKAKRGGGGNQAPQTPAPQTPAPQTPAPQTPAPQTPAPQTPAPQTPAPQTPAPQTPAPQTPAPQTPAPQTTAQQPTAQQPTAQQPTATQPTDTQPGTSGFLRKSTDWAKTNPVQSVALGGAAVGGTAFGAKKLFGGGGMPTPAQPTMYYGQNKAASLGAIASKLLSKYSYDVEFLEELEGLEGKDPSAKYLQGMKDSWVQDQLRKKKKVTIPTSVDTLDKFIEYISKTGSVAAPLLSHLEQRRSERAKFMSKEELASLEKRVRSAKGLPEGANYITLPHGRKGVVRTESGKSHLATILDASMRPPGRDVSKHVKTARVNLHSLLRTVEGGLSRTGLDSLAEEVALYRAKRTIGTAANDLIRYSDSTGRFGQMPRILIPKEHLSLKDIERLGFQESRIAVPELGQTSWVTFRHPLHHMHLHQHGNLLNMHIDSLPSLQMIRERNRLEQAVHSRLLGTVPEGFKPWTPNLSKSRRDTTIQRIVDQASGVGHALLEGVPGYANFAVKSLNPRRIGMAEEILGKLPKDYLEKRYGVVKTSGFEPRLRTTIFGVDPEGNLLHGFGNQGFYKFPGGGVDAGESILDAAKRELLEEAGYDVESIEELSGLDTSDSVGATSAKGHMGHGSSLTKYLLARLGKRNESLLGSEGDAIGNLQSAPIDQVLRGLEGDILFGSGVAASNHAALSRVRDMLQNTSSLG